MEEADAAPSFPGKVQMTSSGSRRITQPPGFSPPHLQKAQPAISTIEDIKGPGSLVTQGEDNQPKPSLSFSSQRVQKLTAAPAISLATPPHGRSTAEVWFSLKPCGDGIWPVLQVLSKGGLNSSIFPVNYKLVGKELVLSVWDLSTMTVLQVEKPLSSPCPSKSKVFSAY
ncbi:Rho-Related Gtp-Binding Protein Rhod [Manis pentadactyla]|nr:Rho-Related Gtp-Binding Protein Rhod [Manis pentadactyla]